MIEITGKTAVVTGGAYGLGAAIATELAKAGCEVALVSRSEDTLKNRASELRKLGRKVIAFTCDISEWQSVQDVVKQIELEFGQIDILINNAGGWTGEALVDIQVSQLTTLVDTMVKGTIYMSKAVLPGMIKRKSGFILNIGSTSGLAGSRDSATASTPKAAIATFTHTLRNEVHQHGIRVAILHPAAVRSKPSFDWSLDELRAEGQFTAISGLQVASIVLFMLSQPENVVIRELTVAPTHAD